MKTTVNAKGTKSLLARGSSIFLLGTLLFLGACSSGLAPQLPEADLSVQSSSCLSGSGKLIKLSGTYNKTVVIKKQNGVRVDARSARINASPALIANYNSGFFCLSGGVYDVGLSLSASWSTYHSHTAIALFNTPRATVEGVAVLNTGDGISVKQNNPGWVFRDSYVKHAGDDGIENDRGSGGRVSNVLIDSAFMGVSCRKEGSNPLKRNSFTIENSLIAMDAKRSAYAFKWTTGTKEPGCVLTLKNNVFLLPKNAGYMDIGDHPQVYSRPLNESACSGNKNTIVYTGGDKSYLEQLKKASPACYNVTTDKSVWTRARDAWFSRHSEFSKYR